MTDLPSGTWNLDPAHSAATLDVRYLTGHFRRGFNSISAQLVDGTLSGSADADSLDLRVDMFREHVLNGAAFFDVGNHPTLTFSSTSLTVNGNDAALEGELTIKGITKPISATGTFAGPIQDQQGNTRIGLSFTTTIDRTDFDVGTEFPVQAMAHEVELDIDLYLVGA
ncbi:MAG TPA: YceI family protein [Solirubrobacteraceae bacterium]|nr:YceI family protein [Solirubrobacteraceae bacterium]